MKDEGDENENPATSRRTSATAADEDAAAGSSTSTAKASSKPTAGSSRCASDGPVENNVNNNNNGNNNNNNDGAMSASAAAAVAAAAVAAMFDKTPILEALHAESTRCYHHCHDSSGSSRTRQSTTTKGQQQQQQQQPSLPSSVKDCFRYRSLPRPVVKRILQRHGGGGGSSSARGGVGGASSPSPPSLTMQDLQLSNASLLSGLMSLKRHAAAQIRRGGNGSGSGNSSSLCANDDDDDDNNNKNNNNNARYATPMPSSMWYVARLSTATDFLQLLLEHDPAKDCTGPQKEAGGDTEAAKNQMAVRLVQCLVGFVASCREVQQQQQEVEVAARGAKQTTDDNGGDDDDRDGGSDDGSSGDCDYYTDRGASTSFRVEHVALFAYKTLLLLQNHYVHAKPFLLSPAWKGLAELLSVTMTTTTTKPSSSNGNQSLIPSSFLSHELVRETASSLVGYLKEGTESTIVQMHRGLTDNKVDQQQQNASLSLQLKILGFLVLRLTTFLPTIMANLPSSSATEEEENTVDEELSSSLPIDRIVYQLSSVLCLLNGIESLFEAAFGRNSQQLQKRPYRQLATKVEKCLLGAIFSNGTGDGSNDDNNAPRSDEYFASCARCFLRILLRAKPLQMWTGAASGNENNNMNDSKDDRYIVLQAFAIGKTTLLAQILQRVVVTDVDSTIEAMGAKNDVTTETSARGTNVRFWSEQDVETILNLCQGLIFDGLPSVCDMLRSNKDAGSSGGLELFKKSTRLVARTLLLCETTLLPRCITVNSQPGQNGFHRFLISWLAVPLLHFASSGTPMSDDGARPNNNQPLHPLSTELAVYILHIHVQGICASMCEKRKSNKDGEAGAAVPLLSLLVKLLLHKHTRTAFRANIAYFVVGLSKDSATRGVIQNLFVRQFAKVLEKHAREYGDISNKTRRKKRKRSSTQASHRFGAEDLQLIFWVACELGHRVPGLDNIPLPCLRHGRSAPERNSKRDLEYASFCISVAAISLSAGGKGTVEELGNVIRIWDPISSPIQDDKDSRSLPPDTVAGLGVSVFRYLRLWCGSASKHPQLSGEAVSLICNLLSRSSSQPQSLLPWRESSPVLFEAISALSSVGNIIQQNTASPVLQDLTRSFHALLSSEHWPIRSFALSAFASFSSTIPVTHKSVLPSCLPKAMRKPFQGRLQNNLDVEPEVLARIHMKSCRYFILSSGSRIYSDNRLLPVSNSYHIPSGSFLLSMPTQGGRSAVVIFPPGDQSLVDIQYMLGNKEQAVKKVHRTVALGDGSCKLLLQDHP